MKYNLSNEITVKDSLTTGNIPLLNDYIPIFDATIVKKLKDGNHTFLGRSENIQATADFLILKDYAGEARINENLIGFKPTYGLVSRFGIFPFASSMDTVSLISKTVLNIGRALDVIKGHDEHDMTSLIDNDKIYTKLLTNEPKVKKLFTLKGVLSQTNKDFLKSKGFEVEEVESDSNLLNTLKIVHQIIACAEATSNHANLTGISFGDRKKSQSSDLIMINSRTQGLPSSLKVDLLFGYYVLSYENYDKLFVKAKKIRRLIVDEFTKLFDKHGVFVFDTKNQDYLKIANLGGFPSLSIKNINLTGSIFQDEIILGIAQKLEEVE